MNNTSRPGKLADYGLPDYFDGTNTIQRTDLVRRLWLDNYFYGTIFSLQYKQKKTQLIIGGYNAYDGRHYGEIKWAAVQAAVPKDHRWYDLTVYKKDLGIQQMDAASEYALAGLC